jgi:hypothetical protein
MSTPIKPYDDPDWVNHCLWLIITKEADDELEKKDKLLKLSMALLPDVEFEEIPPPPHIDYLA